MGDKGEVGGWWRAEVGEVVGGGEGRVVDVGAEEEEAKEGDEGEEREEEEVEHEEDCGEDGAAGESVGEEGEDYGEDACVH